MEMLGAKLTSWSRMLIFFILIEANLWAGMGKAVNELLEGSLGVSFNGGVISEEHLPDEDFAHLCLGSEACQVEQATVTSGVQLDALFGVAGGVTQQQLEQDAKKCRREDAPLFDAAFDRGRGPRRSHRTRRCLSFACGRK